MAVRFYRNNLKYRTSPESSNWTGLMLHTDAENGDISYTRQQILTSAQQQQAQENIGIVYPIPISKGGFGGTSVADAKQNLGFDDYGLNFTEYGKFAAATGDVVAGSGYTFSNGDLNYAVSDNGKWLKLYGWQRLQCSSSAGNLILTMKNAPIVAPESDITVTGIGLGIYHSNIDSSIVANSWVSCYFNCPTIVIKTNGDIEWRHSGHTSYYRSNATYFTGYVWACVIQVADFGDEIQPGE